MFTSHLQRQKTKEEEQSEEQKWRGNIRKENKNREKKTHALQANAAVSETDKSFLSLSGEQRDQEEEDGSQVAVFLFANF